MKRLLDDYRIVVPSRHRAGNMAKLRALLPTAYVTVEESEVDAYAKVMPPELLMPHPKLKNLSAIRNWITDNTPEEAVIMVDDDLTHVIQMGSHAKTLKDPEVLLQILEVDLQLARDLGAGVFCYHRSGNSVLTRPEVRPFRVVMPVTAAFCLRGHVKSKIRWDEEMLSDLDLTMRLLLQERYVLVDARYYWDFGQVFAGKGGNVGTITSEARAADRARLRERWGQYLGVTRKRDGLSKGLKVAIGDSASVRVERLNPAATH